MVRKLVISLLALTTIALPGAPLLYVGNYYTDPKTISVIDAATNAIFDTITDARFDEFMTFLALTPDQNFLYAAMQQIIYEINTSTKQVTEVANTTPSPIGGIFGMAITPDGKKMYVIDRGTPDIKVVNLTTHPATVEKVITFPNPLGADLYFMAITPDGTKAYMPNMANPQVFVFDVINDTYLTTINHVDFNGSVGVAVNPDGKTAYISNATGGSISKIDTVTNTVMSSSITGFVNPIYIVPSPDGKKLYVLDWVSGGTDSAIVTVDVATNSIEESVFLGVDSYSEIIAITPDGKKVYIPQAYKNTVETLTTAIPQTHALVSGTFAYPFAIAAPWSTQQPPTSLWAAPGRAIFSTQVDSIITLSWQAPAGPAPVEYLVYRDSNLTQLAGTTKTTSFADHNRIPGKPYTYYVIAVDTSGNRSAPAIITASC